MLSNNFKFQKIAFFFFYCFPPVIFKIFKTFTLHSKVMLSIVIILSKRMKKYFAFSSFGNICSKLRSRRWAKKSGKLAKIQRFLKKNVEEGEREE